jgi:hypothetical protein
MDRICEVSDRTYSVYMCKTGFSLTEQKPGIRLRTEVSSESDFVEIGRTTESDCRRMREKMYMEGSD